jgi:hypothetical protein
VILAQTQTMALVSTVGTIVTVLSSVQVAVVSGVLSVTGTSLNVVVSGVVSISTWAGAAVTTTQSSLTSGLAVWLAPNQTIGAVATVSTILAVSGVTAVSALSTVVAVSTVTAVVGVSAVSTIVTILGTQVVTVVPGLSVVASISSLPGTTTQSSLSTGLPVIFVQTQTMALVSTVATILAVSGVTAVSAVSTIVTILGTQIITAVPLTSVALSGTIWAETSQSGLTTGIGVWLAPTQTVVASLLNAAASTTVTSGQSGIPVWFGNTLVTITGMVTISTITVTATATVTITATGSVTVTNTGSVSISGTATVTGTIVIATGTVNITSGTIVITTGTVNITSTVVVTNAALAVTTTQSSLTTGLPVWLAPGQTVTVLVSGVTPTSTMSGFTSTLAVPVLVMGGTTAQAAAGTGQLNWLAASQTLASVGTVATVASVLGGLISIQQSTQTNVLILVSSTGLAGGNTLLFSIYTGNTLVATGTSNWAVPAGRVFRVQAIGAVIASSAVATAGQFLVICGTAAASLSMTSTVGRVAGVPILAAATQNFFVMGVNQDVAPATTIAIGIQGAATSLIFGGAVINGYLF